MKEDDKGISYPSKGDSSKDIKNLETKMANVNVNQSGDSVPHNQRREATENESAPEKSKAELRRERREKQLAEKAAKAAAKAGKVVKEGDAPNQAQAQAPKPQKPSQRKQPQS